MPKLRLGMFTVANSEQRNMSKKVEIPCLLSLSANKREQCHNVESDKKKFKQSLFAERKNFVLIFFVFCNAMTLSTFCSLLITTNK